MSIVQTFDIAFPTLSMLSTPIAIVLCSKFCEREHIYVSVVTTLTCVFGLLQLFPYPSTQLVATLAFGPARTLQWACYFHFFATPARYPPEKMGRMVGYANLFIALLGDGPPYLLTAFIRHAIFPTTVAARYNSVHVGLQICISALAVALPLHLAHSRSLRHQALLASTYRAAASARQSNMLGEGELGVAGQALLATCEAHSTADSRSQLASPTARSTQFSFEVRSTGSSLGTRPISIAPNPASMSSPGKSRPLPEYQSTPASPPYSLEAPCWSRSPRKDAAGLAPSSAPLQCIEAPAGQHDEESDVNNLADPHRSSQSNHDWR